MAKDTKKEAPAEAEASAGEPKKGLPIKTIVAVLAMLVVEGAGIVMFMGVMGKPSDVAAVSLETDPQAEMSRIVEVPVLHEKFTNSRQGRVWIWDTEVIVQAKQMHSAELTAAIEEKEALIRTGVSKIIASAQHAYFNEPGRETLTMQVRDFLNQPDVLGVDAEGEPKVVSVLIPSCIGFPADY